MKEYYYVPIVKWKAGEQIALAQLSNECSTKIRPLIEFVDAESYEDQKKFHAKLNQHKIKTFYLDTAIVDETDRNDYFANIKRLLEANFQVCPVILEDEVDELGKELSSISNELAIRIPLPEDSDECSSLFNALEKLSRDSHVEIDLIIDYEYIESVNSRKSCYRETKALIYDFLLECDFIRNIVLSSTSFPMDISNVNAGDIIKYPRYDFELFQKIYSSPKFEPINHKFLYSDYGVTKYTDSEIDFKYMKHGILPKLKYTTENHYLYLKGQRDKTTKVLSVGYPELSEQLITSPDYYGEDFSFGDTEIKERALRIKGPGNSTNWVTIAANHHMSVVIEQLSSLYGF
ncbi:MAG: hypothetical protein JXR88_03575 [Clostridia bacterium]|nr:hypothetical protein [Clostridia bacterium]